MGTPIPLEQFIDQVVAHAQSSAKKPKAIARKRILDANGVSLILLEGDLVYPIWAVMRNHRFRIPLDRDTFDDGILASLFAHYICSSPLGLPMAWHCTDSTGYPITRATEAEVNIFNRETRMDALGWLNKMQAKPGDQLLCKVEDWRAGLVIVELERKAQIDRAVLKTRTQLFTDLVYKQLVDSREQSLTIPIEIPIALAHLPDPTGYPGLNWHDAIKQDKRMRLEGLSIVHHNAPPSLFAQLENLGNRPSLIDFVSAEDTDDVDDINVLSAAKPHSLLQSVSQAFKSLWSKK